MIPFLYLIAIASDAGESVSDWVRLPDEK